MHDAHSLECGTATSERCHVHMCAHLVTDTAIEGMGHRSPTIMTQRGALGVGQRDCLVDASPGDAAFFLELTFQEWLELPSGYSLKRLHLHSSGALKII
jgi:hypothetical protein